MSRHVSRRDLLRLTGLAGARTRFPWLLAGAPVPLMLPTRAPSSQSSDVTLKIIDTTESHGYALAQIAPMWEEKTGVKVVVEQFPYDQTYEKEVLTLSTGTGEYDLIAHDAIWPALFRQNEWLLNLNDFQEDPDLPKLDLEGFAPGLVDAYDRDGDYLSSIPIDYTAIVMAYRKDLFEQAGITEAPKTWEEFAAAAEKIHNPPDVYGWVWHGGEMDAGWTDWAVRVQGFTRPPDQPEHMVNTDGTGAVFADHPYGVEALTLLQEATEWAPPGANGLSYAGASDTFLQGKAGMFISWQVFFADYEDTAKSTVAGKVGYAPPPWSEEQHNYIGGWRLGIASASAHPTEAYQFLQWIGTDEGQKAMLENGSPTAYRSNALADSEWIAKYPVLSAMAELKPQPLRGATNYVEMEQKIYDWLSLFYAGEGSAEEAIQRAQEEANAVFASS